MNIKKILIIYNCTHLFNMVLSIEPKFSGLVINFLKRQLNPTIVVENCLSPNKYERIKLAHSITKAGFQIATARSLYQVNKYQKQYLLIVMHLDCLSAMETIQIASTQNLFRRPYHWLVLYDGRVNETEHPAYQLLLTSPVLADSDVVLARQLANGAFHLIEIHKPAANESIVETAIGWYNGTEFFDVNGPRELFRRRKNLMLHPLTMINVIVDSNSSVEHIPKEDRLEPHFDSLTKICWIIVHLGFQMLNATAKYTFASSFGYKNELGQWNGAINLLMTHQGDLATSCLPTHDRSEVVSFTEMVAKTEVAFIFRQPPLSYVVSIYTLPFSKNVWMASIVCIIVSGLALFFATKWESLIQKSPTQPDGTLGDAFLLTMSAVCQQGCVLEPKKISGRMIILFMFTALMALYAAYSANIVVLLRAPSHAITSLQKLYDSKITLAANNVDYNHFLLKGLFAFHSMKDPVYRRIEKTFQEIEKCDLVEVDLLNQFEPLLPVPKDSPYNELFKVVFKQIRESGLQDAVIRRLQVSKPKCSGSIQAFNSVGIIDFYPAIIFMLYGFSLAILILFVEIIVYKMHK